MNVDMSQRIFIELAQKNNPNSTLCIAINGPNYLGSAFKKNELSFVTQLSEEITKHKGLLFPTYPEELENSKSFKNLIIFKRDDKTLYNENALLDLGGLLYNNLKANKKSIPSLSIDLDSFLKDIKPQKAQDFSGKKFKNSSSSFEELFERFSLGFLLASYNFHDFKSEKKKETSLAVHFFSKKLTSAKIKKIFEDTLTIAEAIFIARDLGNTPGNYLRPKDLADFAQGISKNTSLKTIVFDEKKLKKMKMNGILGVGAGSPNPPRLIVMEHNMHKKNLPLLALVGKGITFDTGGISLKQSASMEEMKYDMCGSAATIAFLKLANDLKLPIRVLGIVPSAENKPGLNALNPGDVYTSYSGKTVEVLNTDAEGRLVLADALSYVQEKYKPNYLIDIATLTGAVLVALGGATTGVMSNDHKAAEKYLHSARKSGEFAWELPLWEHFNKEMKSDCADLRNMGRSRWGGASKAAAFLSNFIEKGQTWIHLDVAGSAMEAKDQGAHCPAKSGTGVPVYSLLEFARSMKKK